MDLNRVGKAVSAWKRQMPTDLLRACLLEGPAVAAAFGRCRATLDPGDPAHRQLLFLLRRNLLRHHVPAPELDFVDARRRALWASNQALLALMNASAQALAARGIRCVPLKGAALQRRFYTDLSVRPMGDIDLLVPAAQIEAARRCLREAGWTDPAPATAVRARLGHALHFTRTGGEQILDLHYHAVQHRTWHGADRCFWEETALGPGDDALRLSPEALLVQICSHAWSSRLALPSRWAADAYTILHQQGGAINWRRVVEMAAQLRVSLTLSAALSYLSEALDARIPGWVVGELAALRSDNREARLQYARYLGAATVSDRVAYNWAVYRMAVADVPLPRKLVHLPAYIKYRTYQTDRYPLVRALLSSMFLPDSSNPAPDA